MLEPLVVTGCRMHRVQFRAQFSTARPRIPDACNRFLGRDGVDAALSPTASQCVKLVMLKSQEDREGIHEKS